MKTRASYYPIPVKCDYCGADVIYTSNAEVYGKEYGNGRCYKCTVCDAYVGVHTGTNIPLGRLADRELRKLKKECHALFDQVWKGGCINRSKAYAQLAKRLEIPVSDCHFGWFDKETLCKAKAIMKTPGWYKEPTT